MNRGLGGFLVRRLIRLVLSVFVLVTVTFFMVQLIPGNPVTASLGDTATPAVIKLRTEQLGLDKPLVVQYLDYLRGVVTGHLGESFVSSEPVSQILIARVPPTLQLAIPAFILVVLIAFPLGLFMAIRTNHGKGRKTLLSFVVGTGIANSIPDFVWATILSVVLIVWLKKFPVAGDTGFKSHVLPVAALVLPPTATLSRIVRVEALKILDSPYVLAARGRRVPTWLLYTRHVLPNMVTASLTYGGMVFAALIAGTILVENIFAWPGLGTEISQAVLDKDYPVIQGILIVLGSLVLLIQLVVDLTLGAFDPRSRITET